MNDGRGRAYGGELLVRQQLWRNLFGWVAYTLSRSERKDHPGEAWHVYVFDQTNILTLLASYRLPRGFQVGARFRYVTGNPYTPVTGAYFDANADRYVPISGAAFSGRLPAFNQLDLRVDKIWTFDRWRFSAYLDVQNTTRATNPEALSYNFDFTVVRSRWPALPLLPIVGRAGGFLMTADRLAMLFDAGVRGRRLRAGRRAAAHVHRPGRACWRSRPSRRRCAPGESTTVTALIVGTGSETPSVSWARCRLPAASGRCRSIPTASTRAQADDLEPIGEGATITTTMPATSRRRRSASPTRAAASTCRSSPA